MKNDSPNKFLGGIAAGIAGLGGSQGFMNNFLQSSLARAAQQVAGPSQAQQTSMLGNAGSSIGGGTGTASAAPVDPVAPMAPTGGDMQDPFAGKTFSIVESPANMKGNAKPVFNESTSDAAAMMYGSPLDRQISMPKAGTSAMALKDIPKGDDGKGLRALDDSVVEQMGYDSATKMVSPLGLHKPGHVEPRGPRNSVGAVMIGKEIPKKMSKTLRKIPPKQIKPYTKEQLQDRNETIKQAFGITKDGKKVNLGTITSTEIPFKDFKQR